MTTVAQPAEQVAQLAVGQLLRRTAGATESPVQVILPGNLIIRASCGCNPALSKRR
jgi:DNA-binding LacI/PurR family transcriptional regulator